MLTFQDAIDNLLGYAGDDASGTGTTKVRRAVQAAYRAVPTRHDWAYLWTLGRITTNASYATGTIAYDHTGGANERQLTLTDGTWPSWAAYGYVMIDSIPYTVSARVSDTIVQLAEGSNPGEDVAADTDYQLYRDSYPLPSNFVHGDETVANSIGSVLEYVHPRNWSSSRRTSTGSGSPSVFSYLGDPNVLGSLRMVLWPPPDAVYQIDFLYRRSPRAMVFEAHQTGLVSCTADGTTITGSGTAFNQRMVGSIIRFAADNVESPTGPGGGVPAIYERTITAVASATSLTVGEAMDESLTEVKFTITDPCDIDGVGMVEYFQRECEKQFRIQARSVVAKLDEERDYGIAFTRALENDSKYTGRAASLRRQSRRSGYDHHPLDWGT